MKFKFSVKEKIKEAWSIYKENFWMFFLLSAIVFLLEVLSTKGFVAYILACVASLLLAYMLIKYLLSLVDKKEFNVFAKSSLPTIDQIWKLFKTYILYILIVAGAFISLFMPAMLIIMRNGILLPWMIALIILAFIFLIIGTYFKIRLFFSVIISVDKDQGAIKSIKNSWWMTKDMFWYLFWKTIVVGLFMMIGFLALVVGLIVTIPIGMLVLIMMYRDLEKWRGEVLSSGEVVEEKITVIEENGVPVAEVIEEKIVEGN